MHNVISTLLRDHSAGADAKLLKFAREIAKSGHRFSTGDKTLGLGKELFTMLCENPIDVKQIKPGLPLPQRLFASGVASGGQTLASLLSTLRQLFVAVDCGVKTLASTVVVRLRDRNQLFLAALERLRAHQTNVAAAQLLSSIDEMVAAQSATESKRELVALQQTTD